MHMNTVYRNRVYLVGRGKGLFWILRDEQQTVDCHQIPIELSSFTASEKDFAFILHRLRGSVSQEADSERRHKSRAILNKSKLLPLRLTQ